MVSALAQISRLGGPTQAMMQRQLLQQVSTRRCYNEFMGGCFWEAGRGFSSIGYINDAPLVAIRVKSTTFRGSWSVCQIDLSRCCQCILVVSTEYIRT